MPWSAPSYSGGVVWEDAPSTLTPLNAADLNTEENAEATYAVQVGQSVVNYFEIPAGGSTAVERTANKGQPNGYMGLDASSRGAQAPMLHAAAHAPAGSDPLTLADLPASVVSASRFYSPSGGDDSAAFATGIAAGGTHILGPGTFLWNAQVPGLSRSTPAKVQGAGVSKTVVQLSSGAPRFLDFNKVADGDVFSDIEIGDVSVNCNNIGGKHHVVIGTYRAGVLTTKISINNLTVRRVRTLNVPTDSTLTNNRGSIYIMPQVATADPAETLNDHVYEDLDFTHGGNQGLIVGANCPTPPSACTYDRISIKRVKHDTLATQGPTSFSSAGIQIGQYAPGGHIWIDECYSANSGDVGIEIDNHGTLAIKNTIVQDSVTAEYLFRTFAAPSEGAQKQTALLELCEARIVNQVLSEGASAQSTGFYMGNASDQQAGRFTYRNCKFLNETALIGFGPNNTESVGLAMHSIGPIYGVTLERFLVVAESLSLAPADTQQPRIIALNHGGTTDTKVKGLRIRLAGSKSGGVGTQSIRLFSPGGTVGTDDMTVHIEDYDIDMAMTGLNGSYGLLPGFIGGKLRGTIRRLRVISQGDNAALANTIFISSNPNLAKKLLIADCDFTNTVTPGNEISINAAQRPNVYYEHNLWKTYPAPSVAMSSSNFNTGTFVTATGNQYIGCYGATIQMTGGAGVTLIELSKDNSQYDTIWTQASGALSQAVQFHVDNGDYVRVTFATTQPVTRIIPDK